MDNEGLMIFIFQAIIALFAFFVVAPCVLNAVSLFTVQKRFAKTMIDLFSMLLCNRFIRFLNQNRIWCNAHT